MSSAQVGSKKKRRAPGWRKNEGYRKTAITAIPMLAAMRVSSAMASDRRRIKVGLAL
jgi:hypothetical protein